MWFVNRLHLSQICQLALRYELVDFYGLVRDFCLSYKLGPDKL